MMERFWSLFYARNMEYFRDRSALAWSLLFPFLLLLGFYFMFDRDAPPDQVKVALTGRAIDNWQQRIDDLPYVSVVKVDKISVAREKLAHHKVHLVLDTGSKPMRYWVSETSVQSYLAERLVIRELQHQAGDTLQSKTGPAYERLTMTGEEIPYLEWFFPGILGMNLMFSAIFGVGYVIVRYRKNGVLKRISVTPVSAFEFLAAQIASRMFLTAFMTGILLGGGMLLFGFQVRGSWLALLLLFFWGSASLCAAGLWVAARTESEEFAGGMMNLLTWPMMFLSEVWFSLEGAPAWLEKLALAMPLTHMIRGVRQVMNDGASLSDVMGKIMLLILLTALFLALGSWRFRWQRR